MIKRLQRKFVVIAAVCLLIVEFAIIGGINGVNIYQTNKNADDLLNIIIENDGKDPRQKAQSQQNKLQLRAYEY